MANETRYQHARCWSSGAGLAGSDCRKTAYLRTMLPCANSTWPCGPGFHGNALPQQSLPVHDGWDSSRQPFLSRFHAAASIDFFTTWQGSVLYALISLGLLYGAEHPSNNGLRRPKPTDPGGRWFAPAAGHAGRPG